MAVTHEEIKKQFASDETLVDRLRTEKQILLKKVQQEGYELGIRSAIETLLQRLSAFLSECVLWPIPWMKMCSNTCGTT